MKSEMADRAPAQQEDRSSPRLDARSAAELAAGMACFGSAIPVSALVGKVLPLWPAAGARLIIAAGVVLPVYRLTGRSNRSLRSLIATASWWDRLLLTGMAVVGTVAFTALMFAGMQRAPGSVAAVVMATTPAVTAAGAWLVLHEPLGGRRAAAVATGVVGVVVVNLGAQTGDGLGNVMVGSALVFAAVCCEASYSLMGKRLTGEYSPLMITMVVTALAALLTLPLAAWSFEEASVRELSGSDWVALVWWGAGSMALGSWLWFSGMKQVRASTASAFMAVMPVSGLLLSYVLLGEEPTWWHALGMLLVLGGLALVASADQDPSES